MRIRKIKIENYGSIDCFEQILDKDMAIIQSEQANEIMLAVAGILSYPTRYLGDFNKGIRENTNITIYTDDVDDIERLNQMNIIGVNKESLACSIFCNNENEQFSERLRKYKLSCDYYKRNEFSRLTDSFGDTNVFRWHLGKYIKRFVPLQISAKKELEMLPDRDGVFYLRKASIKNKYSPSMQEKLLLELYSFVKLHDFWEEAAELRTLNAPEMPIMIGNILEYLDIDENRTKSSLKRILETKSQVIIFQQAY